MQVIDYIELKKSLDKIKLYNKEFESSFDDYITNIYDIENNYHTDNLSKINDLINEINNSFCNINYNNYRKANIIENKIIEYKETEENVRKYIDNIKW